MMFYMSNDRKWITQVSIPAITRCTISSIIVESRINARLFPVFFAKWIALLKSTTIPDQKLNLIEGWHAQKKDLARVA
jgi:hypothetical protein